ncbi:MAG: glycoside hydrolase family 11 protein, partial [Oscillospiraceae bacterium]|nr:glycoside hydrolase family 11 protein [Oscillospiraceae bacterium]
MNRKYTTQISALLMSAAVTAASCPPAALVRAVDLNETGMVDGYTYNLWNQNGTGDVEFTPDADGKLDLKFSPVESIVLAKGSKFESQYKWSSYGKITANYDIDYSIIDFRPEEGFVNHSALLGIYGWTLRPTTEYYTENPKTEYYVVEGWYKWRPPGSDTLLETVEIDGKLYDIYVTHTITMGGIIGTDNGWQQFWSIRRDSEIDESPGSMSGTVTLSEHFKVWEKYGFDPDAKLCDTSVNAEVYRCSGQITMNKGCEILTEYTNEQLAKTEPAEPAVTDPKPEIT